MAEKNAFSINNNFSITVIPSLHGAVVKDQSSIIADSEGVSSNPEEAILLNFVHFFVFGFLIIFFLWLVFLYSHCWSFKALRGFCNNVFLVIRCDKSRRLALQTKERLVVSAFYINWWAKISFSFTVSIYSPGNEWWRGGFAQCHWHFFNNRTISRMLIGRQLWSRRVQTMEMMWWWLHTLQWNYSPTTHGSTWVLSILTSFLRLIRV